MKICKHCNNNFTKKEHKGKQFYCSPKCTYEANCIRRKKYYKGAAYYRELRKNPRTLSTDKIIMPKANYNCSNFNWYEIDKLTNKGGAYG